MKGGAALEFDLGFAGCVVSGGFKFPCGVDATAGVDEGLAELGAQGRFLFWARCEEFEATAIVAGGAIEGQSGGGAVAREFVVMAGLGAVAGALVVERERFGVAALGGLERLGQRAVQRAATGLRAGPAGRRRALDRGTTRPDRLD